MCDEVLKFWFEEIAPAKWWSAQPGIDELINARFLELHQRASQGELYTWRNKAKGRLAEIIVLDQFSRNIYRNTPCAFAVVAVPINQTLPPRQLRNVKAVFSQGYQRKQVLHCRNHFGKKLHPFACIN